MLEGQPVKKGDVVARMVSDDARIALARAEAAVLEREGELKQAEAAREAAAREWENPVERTRAVAFGRGDARRVHGDARAGGLADRRRGGAGGRAGGHAPTHGEVGRDQRGQRSPSSCRRRRSSMRSGRCWRRRRRTSRCWPPRSASSEAELDAARSNAKLRITERRAVSRVRGRRHEGAGGAGAGEGRARRGEAAARPHGGPLAGRRRRHVAARRAGVDDDARTRTTPPPPTPCGCTTRGGSRSASTCRSPTRPKVGVGQKAKVVVGVLPDRTFDGEVTRIVHEADIQKNTLQVKVAITDPVAGAAPGDARPRAVRRRRRRAATTSGGAATSQQVFAPESLLQAAGPDGRRRRGSSTAAAASRELRTVTLGDGRVGRLGRGPRRPAAGRPAHRRRHVAPARRAARASRRRGRRAGRRIAGTADATEGGSPWRSLNAASSPASTAGGDDDHAARRPRPRRRGRHVPRADGPAAAAARRRCST